MAAKQKTKKLTLETFAAAILRDLARTATKDNLKILATKQDLERFATKDDIAKLREETAKLRDEMATKKEDIAALGDRIVTAKDELHEQIAGLRYAKEIDDLRERVNLPEKKLGVGHGRRAA